MISDRDLELKSDRELLIITARTVQGVEKRVAEINGCVRSHSARITRLESWKDLIKWMLGGGTGGGIIIGVLKLVGVL